MVLQNLKKGQSKIEDHFKFCPECGSSLNQILEKDIKGISLFDSIKEKVNKLPLKHTGILDSHIQEARLNHKRAYEPWGVNEIAILNSYCDQFSNTELSELFGRSLGGIKSRLIELNVS